MHCQESPFFGYCTSLARKPRTLILTTPLSFEGRIIQYAGRLHRQAAEKTEVQIIDFVDSYIAMSLKMYRNRIKTYRKMGYKVAEHGYIFSGRQSSMPFAGAAKVTLQKITANL